jgi:hypothetical protein
MKYLFIICLIGATVNICAQPKTIFKDDFKNNRHHWKLYDDSDFVVNIREGKLHIEKKEINRIRNGCLWYSKKIPKLNTLKDFEIIFFAKISPDGENLYSIDMQWGQLNDCDSCDRKNNLYQFDFRPERVRLSMFSTSLKPRWLYFNWSNSPSNIFKPNDFNKYEIQQIGDFVLVKINNTIVDRRNIKTISGESIGILNCLKNSWEIDKIIIKQ